MKKITILFSAFVLMATTGSDAQESASAVATAIVIAPIAITKTSDMNFGRSRGIHNCWYRSIGSGR